MIYHKFQLSDEVEMKVEFYEDQLFTYCVDCREEIHLTKGELVQLWEHGGDSPSTSFLCPGCTKQE